MGASIDEYLIEHEGVNWTQALASWAWMLPSGVNVWLVNRFGDVFLETQDGTVHMLDVGGGTLARVAKSRDDFRALIDVDDHAADWLMIPLVDRLVEAGKLLQAGQCYGFGVPPVLGGEYSIENSRQIAAADWIGFCGELHDQIRTLPDGASVVLKSPDQSK